MFTGYVGKMNVVDTKDCVTKSLTELDTRNPS